MYRRQRSPVPLEHPMVMLANAHLRQLERDIERMRLAALVRARRPRERASLPAPLRWLRARLAARARSGPTDASRLHTPQIQLPAGDGPAE